MARFGLPDRPLQTDPAQLVVEFPRWRLEIRDRQGARLGPSSDHLHDTFSSAKRVANRVLIGSFADASRMAAFASSIETPSISKRIRPGLTTATQPSGDPLPLPMRVSCGFFVMGLSG